LKKVLRRHLISTLVAASFVTIILASAIVAWSLYLRSVAASNAFQAERDKAEQRGVELRRSLYFAEMNLAGQASNEPGGIDRVEELVNRWPYGPDSLDLRGWEWFYLRSLSNREVAVVSLDELVWCVAISPSGEQILTGGASRLTGLWDVGGKPSHTRLATGRLPVRSVDWSNDGQWFAAGSTDRSVTVWDAQQRRVLHDLNHGGPVLTVAFHPSKPWLATGGNGGGCKVWNVHSGTLVHNIDQAGVLNSIRWSPAGQRIAFAGRESGIFHVCHLTIGADDVMAVEQRFQVAGHASGVFSVEWSPDGNRIASCDAGGSVKVWDASQGAECLPLWTSEYSSEVWNLRWSPNGDELVVVSEDGSVRILDAVNGRLKEDLLGHTSAVWGCCWSRDGQRVVTAGHDGTVRIWNSKHRYTNIHAFSESQTGFTSLDWSPDGSTLVTGGTHGEVMLWDADSGEKVKAFQGHEGE
ncbi:MAG: WD40 repeat domain-containing protein, partial [Planctomycetales bacterium]|nr:WD40 repeat domain-containing protein [Planctomycetales bacterium]